MKTEHTKGPWHVGITDSQSVRADGLLVATMACQRKEWQANARLIAAAPELLEALERAVDIIQGEWPEEQWAEQGMPAMLAAIKKAKGE